MNLPGDVERASPSVPGFDCDTPLSADIASQFFTQGYKFCFRYLSTEQVSARDLSEPEAKDILNSGLALMPVQHSSKQGWSPGMALGRQHGQAASMNAQAAGFPHGVNLWCDLEGVSNSAITEDVIDYCKAWYEAVSAAGYMPGLYVGKGALLSGGQLFDLPFQHYWRSPSQVPNIPRRAYQVIQLGPPIQLNGILIDIDVAVTDSQGGAAQWLRAKRLVVG